MRRREAKIEADNHVAKSYGKVTSAERAKLQREENRASRKIHEKKHNARTETPAS